jgi:hypothetical protein
MTQSRNRTATASAPTSTVRPEPVEGRPTASATP